MKVVLFCHSLASDWNHGNAHFLRGIVRELQLRGHRVDVYEPRDGWSAANLVRDHGPGALAEYRTAYPRLASHRYGSELDLEKVLEGADLVLVHEWNEPSLVGRIGRSARDAGARVLFHDTHHRSATRPADMAAFDFSHYDGVLAFGDVIRRRYLEEGWAARAWTWHEAADVRHFRPVRSDPATRDLVWIGNWGDGERTEELRTFLLDPVSDLREEGLPVSATSFGVRYPPEALATFRRAGFRHAGRLPNHRVPELFSRHRVTVHVPRGPYARALPGIPTIRVFEALACGIPLVCSPWDDAEGLFSEGEDYLVARTGRQMRNHLRALLHDAELRRSLVDHGRRTILRAHTCGHRVDRLLEIVAELNDRPGPKPLAAAQSSFPPSGTDTP